MGVRVGVVDAAEERRILPPGPARQCLPKGSSPTGTTRSSAQTPGSVRARRTGPGFRDSPVVPLRPADLGFDGRLSATGRDSRPRRTVAGARPAPGDGVDGGRDPIRPEAPERVGRLPDVVDVPAALGRACAVQDQPFWRVGRPHRVVAEELLGHLLEVACVSPGISTSTPTAIAHLLDSGTPASERVGTTAPAASTDRTIARAGQAPTPSEPGSGAAPRLPLNLSPGPEAGASGRSRCGRDRSPGH